ncbi:MAG: ABC transporter permease [Candidatus Aminicenantes bacterium]|nr:ABC transporter permease [Candidatus Aminicenantes bacterium]
MKFEFFVARRYLVKGRKKSFISVISLVSIIGIAIGVAALIIALTLINGFQGDIRNKILSSTSHIMINNIIGEGMAGYEDVTEVIKEKFGEVTAVSPIVSGAVLIKGSSRNTSGAVVWGLDLDTVGDKEWLKKLKRGRLPFKKNEMILGSEIASRVSLFEGSSCKIFTPTPVLSPSGLLPSLKKFKISGVFHSGLYEIDNSTVVTNLATAQKLFGMRDKVSFIQVYLKDMFAAEQVAARMRDVFPVRLQVSTWMDLNASLYTALKLEKTILFFTLTLIIVVASLNIIAGLILLVIQKIKDIGILLSYGATPKIIKRIFFIQGSIIGIIGTALGVVIGLVFCALANRFELIKIPAEIYQMSYVPFNVNLFDLLSVVLVSLLISFTATLIPSRKAASVNVIEALKNE